MLNTMIIIASYSSLADDLFEMIFHMSHVCGN